ncbi:hypothetical protein GCM10009566_21970 [Streptomyces murinus]
MRSRFPQPGQRPEGARGIARRATTGPQSAIHPHPYGAYRLSTAGAEPGSGRPAVSDIRHTANPPITAAAIM